MKIAHVKSLYDRIGGIESLLGNLMPEMLDQPDVEPLVILIADRRHPEIESRLSAGGRVQIEIIPWQGLKAAPLAARRLRRIVRDNNVDVLHTHDMRANLLTALQKPFGRTPWLCHMHGWLGDTHRGKHKLYEAIDRRLIRFADHVLVGSHAALDEVQAAGARRASVAWNAVKLPDLDPSDRVALGLPENAVIATVLGRLHFGKGQDMFLDALSALASQSDWHGVLVGVGDPETEAALKARADALGLSQRVTFTGFVPETGPWIAASDIVVVPSRKESLPLTCLEGMAAARPVIVSDTGDLPRVVKDGATGIVIGVDDTAALTSALARLIGDTDLRAKMGQAARQTVEANHTAGVLAAECVSAAKDVLNLRA